MQPERDRAGAPAEGREEHSAPAQSRDREVNNRAGAEPGVAFAGRE
ncbi:hypothetical protein [Acetobacter indonesiensis]|nr:hypothetical protein [Acetobacter indonesiensis]MCG0994737.1 hypothetical protein [Acetobacter indonesiensis]MCP1229981.1 hypothetical protein [Acetobacter indonesiensis]